MRAVVFRSLSGLVGVLFFVGALLGNEDGNGYFIIPMATLFLTYAALGEARIRWVMELFGSKPNIEKRTGKKGDRGW